MPHICSYVQSFHIVCATEMCAINEIVSPAAQTVIKYVMLQLPCTINVIVSVYFGYTSSETGATGNKS